MTVYRNIRPGKLQSPRLGVQTLARARLYQQIDTGLKSNLTTIVAPAGFGKTVLLTGWLAQRASSTRASPTAWLSLDANDDHLPTFVRYLALAIETLFPDGCRETLSLVNALLPPDPALLTDNLLFEIGNLPEPFVLILDDYHALANPQIHTLVTSLIEQVPRPHRRPPRACWRNEHYDAIGAALAAAQCRRIVG